MHVQLQCSRYIMICLQSTGIYIKYYKGIVLLTLYIIITPFDTFEISCIQKYYEKWSICSFGAMLHIPSYFQSIKNFT